MKKQIFNIMGIMMIGLVVVACKDKAKEAETSEAGEAAIASSESVKFLANVDESVIEWKGFKPTGTHTGTIALENGVFSASNGNIESGTFLIDMKSIANTDMPADSDGNMKLVGHLKSADFFDVEQFGTAAFAITGLQDGVLSGNLTIKGVENKISFPVTVANDGDNLSLTSEAFTIDRSKWNVKYGSKSFFDDLGDKFINDDIELKINIKANKKGAAM